MHVELAYRVAIISVFHILLLVPQIPWLMNHLFAQLKVVRTEVKTFPFSEIFVKIDIRRISIYFRRVKKCSVGKKGQLKNSERTFIKQQASHTVQIYEVNILNILAVYIPRKPRSQTSFKQW